MGAGEGNVIAFNGGAGVYIDYSTINIEKNPIRGNSIYGNGTANGAGGRSTLGIDLGNQTGAGLTLNDDQDADAGPNTNQNFPLIASAVSGGGDTTIEGSFNSTPSTTFTIDFYSNSACLGRPQGFIQGRTYLGSTQVTTNGSGNAAIDAVLDGVTLEAGDVVTATATDPDGNTSEFSQRIVVSSTPGSGPATGAGISLSGFNFLAGAHGDRGRRARDERQRRRLQPDHCHDSVAAAGKSQQHHRHEHRRDDGHAARTAGSRTSWTSRADISSTRSSPPSSATPITVGVGGGNYGAAQNTLRQQMAVFLLKAKFGICYTPPPCTVPAFPDVPCSSNFAPWINELVAQGITGGCAGGNFCPTSPVNRQQMAVFLLKAFEGSGYTPPACTVATFTDVPCSHQFAPWIYELVARNITAGCGGGNYCPGTSANRGQIAAFIVKTFGLPVIRAGPGDRRFAGARGGEKPGTGIDFPAFPLHQERLECMRSSRRGLRHASIRSPSVRL